MKATRISCNKDHLTLLWRSVGGENDVLEVEALQIEKQRSVLRLHLDREHPPVIAKYCPTVDAEREFGIYREMLPASGIRAPKAYGFSHDNGSRRSWLFMENISGRPYDLSDKADQELAGTWLAALHTQAHRANHAFHLGDRSSEYYQPYVGKSIELLEPHCESDELTEAERDLLKRIRDFCMVLESHWPAIESFCKSMPQTLIHGDFKEDNMRVVDAGEGPRIVAFDWANSGWGAPGLDLAKFTGYSVAPDLDRYLAMCRSQWPDLDKASLVRLGYIGEIFRWAETVRWHVDELNYGRKLSVMVSMPVYAMWMDEINRMAPWMEPDLVTSGRWNPLKKHWH